MNRQSGRIQELDALRGLAAVAVMLFHFTTQYDRLFGRSEPLPFSFYYGDFGVELFFMLSGFVIFMTLDRTKSVMDFVVGRFGRLYPVYWVAVGLTFAVVAFASLPGQETTVTEAVLNATMVQRLFGVRHVDGAYWSLQAELFFYAAMLALHATGALRRPLTTIGIWIATAYAVEWLLLVPWDAAGTSRLLTKLQTLLSLKNFHLFAIGLLWYRMRCDGRVSAKPMALAIICLAYRATFDSWIAAFIVVALAVLLAAAAAGTVKFLNRRSLVFLGAISYPLYLIHQNIGYVVIRSLSNVCNPITCVGAAVAVALLLAVGLHYGVEQPAARLVKAVRVAPTWSLRWRALRTA